MTNTSIIGELSESDVIARPNILIVDDRRENLMATEKILRNLSAGIFKAQSGNEALSLMLRHKFAVVLLDVQMPEMDGFETATLMQEHESMRGVPIIFVTAISKEEKYATRAAEIGAVDYIFKPINSDILCSKIKVYIDLYIQREHILKLNKSLIQSNEELERFAYICSHDLQEPIRLMNVYSGILKSEYASILDEVGNKYIGVIERNANQMHQMVSDILTFSRLGHEKLKIETVDCNQIMKELLLEFDVVIKQKKAALICNALPVVESSETLLRVLLQNLIGNALKFQDGSRVPEIKIEARQKGNEWEFTIQDNGIGIDPRYNNKVFAPFQRLNHREDYPGTGIGLSTCRKLIGLYGGQIWFESELGKGTRFFFTIMNRLVATIEDLSASAQ